MNNKIYNRFKASEKIFRCPLCASQMEFRNHNSLVCSKNHCFDLSKLGYVNFAPHQNKMKYTKELFESRRCIFECGFYDPMKDGIQNLIDKYFDSSSKNMVLDAGCGEGFFVSTLFGNDEQSEIFAVDILKGAIALASKNNDTIRWIVGDLSNIPLQSNTINLLLNIFAPANFNEFLRVMNDNGILIKVVPGKQYLKELRECAGNQLISKEYSNEKVLQLFHKNMVCLESVKLFYQEPVSERHLKNFIQMTPMMFNVDTSTIDLRSIKSITIDAEIVIGQKSK